MDDVSTRDPVVRFYKKKFWWFLHAKAIASAIYRHVCDFHMSILLWQLCMLPRRSAVFSNLNIIQMLVNRWSTYRERSVK